MVIAFCGHSEIYDIFELEERVLGLLRNYADGHSVEMLIGGYGDFDDLAYRCGKRLRDDGGAVSLIYITPYLNMAERRAGYDVTLYPEIEDKPPKFAIVYRNRWMVDKADLVIAYVNYRRGGAYKTYAYAKRKGKTVINFGELC